MSTVTLGLLQHACTANPAQNLKKTLALTVQAAKAGAKIICTQELFRSQYFCQSEDHANFALAEAIPGPSTAAFQKGTKGNLSILRNRTVPGFCLCAGHRPPSR